MIHGSTKFPPTEALRNNVFGVQRTIGPQFVQLCALSVVVPPGVWFHAGWPLPERPNCVVFGLDTGFALTPISCWMFPFESTSRPIVENTVLATQFTVADAVSVIVTTGAVVGATMPQFQTVPAGRMYF